MTGPSQKKTLLFGSLEQPSSVVPPQAPPTEAPFASGAPPQLASAPPTDEVQSAWAPPLSPSAAPHGPKGTLVVPSPFTSDAPPAGSGSARPGTHADTPEFWLDRAAESLLAQPQEDPSGLGPPILPDEASSSHNRAQNGRAAKAWFDSLEPRRRRAVLGVGIGACGLALLVAIVAATTRPSLRFRGMASLNSARLSDLNALALAGPPVPTTTPIAAPTGPVGPCTLSGEPKQFAPKASKDVPIEVRINASRAEVGVGFASDARTASGLVLDLRTLEIRDRFRASANRIGRVVPVASEQGFSFQVHAATRAGQDDNTLTVTTRPTRVVSWKKDELAVAGTQGAGAASWKLEGKPAAVRTLAVADKGAAIAFRLEETIELAWIDQNGQPAGELSAVQSPGSRLGAPSLAWNGAELLVAFAARESDDSPWSIRVARAAFGLAVSNNRVWTVPEGGPGGPVIAPSVTNVDQGGWLMLWTEGKQGQREVRMQTCNKDLEPVGEARTVSGHGNAGQGVGAVTAGKGLVTYLVGSQSHELWGAGIECP